MQRWPEHDQQHQLERVELIRVAKSALARIADNGDDWPADSTGNRTRNPSSLRYLSKSNR